MEHIPADVLSEVCIHLPLATIKHLSKTCKSFNLACRHNNLWKAHYRALNKSSEHKVVTNWREKYIRHVTNFSQIRVYRCEHNKYLPYCYLKRAELSNPNYELIVRHLINNTSMIVFTATNNNIRWISVNIHNKIYTLSFEESLQRTSMYTTSVNRFVDFNNRDKFKAYVIHDKWFLADVGSYFGRGINKYRVPVETRTYILEQSALYIKMMTIGNFSHYKNVPFLSNLHQYRLTVYRSNNTQPNHYSYENEYDNTYQGPDIKQCPHFIAQLQELSQSGCRIISCHEYESLDEQKYLCNVKYISPKRKMKYLVMKVPYGN